jgi:hypothetical protein
MIIIRLNKIAMYFIFMLVFSARAFAFEADNNVWTWRYSTDKQSVYSYNAPPELISINKSKGYVEFTGYVLSVWPNDPQVSHYQSKIRVGIKPNEQQMWIEYLNQVAYDENNNKVEIKDNPKANAWHPVMHNTSEEMYGLALFQTFKEYTDAGYYNKIQ